MRTFKNFAAQGDVYFRKIDKLPENAVKCNPERGFHVIAHSETGHNHVMEAEHVTMYSLPDDIMKCLLVVDSPTELQHLREYDRHESIMFERGIFEVRRQREYTPEGSRKAQD